MNKEQKAQAVTQLQDHLSRAKIAILTNYRGLNVAQFNQLRRQLREANVEFHVVKNTLTRLAARTCNFDGLEPGLEGPTALAVDFHDPAVAARVLTKFMAGEKKLQFKSAVLAGRSLTLQEVNFLAELPPIEGMRARLIGTFSAPQRRLLGVLGGVQRRLLGILEAYARRKESDGVASGS